MAKCYGTKSVKRVQLQNEREPYVETREQVGLRWKKKEEWNRIKQIADEAKERARRKSGKSEELGKTNGFAIYGVVNFQTKERKYL